MMNLTLRCFLLLVPVCLLMTGCGRSGPEVVPVEGKVTYGGGIWPRAGMLYFTPVEPAVGFPNRPAWAEFAADGSFRATSFKPGDGLVPGRYQVAVECWDAPPAMGSKTPARSCVLPKYRSPTTSGFEVSVSPGQKKVALEWDVPKSYDHSMNNAR
jgi:hypothetical protein